VFERSARANVRNPARSDIRILKQYYELALSLAPTAGVGALQLAMLSSPDTKSLVVGANLTAEKVASTIRHIDNPWLFYPLMGRANDPALLLAAGDEIVRNTPDFAWGYAIRARSYFNAIVDPLARSNLRITRVELHESIIRNVEIALALAPDMASAYYLRARVEEARGQYQDAEFDYNRAISLQPSYCEARLSRGVLFSKMDRDEEALDDASEVISKCPNLLQAYQNRASVLRRLKRYDEAVLDYSFVYENATDELRYHALNDRAATQMETNFWQLGCNDYEELERIGNKEGGLNFIASNLGLAQCAERGSEFELATHRYLKVVERFHREYSNRAAFFAVQAAYKSKPFVFTQEAGDLFERIRVAAAQMNEGEDGERGNWDLLLASVSFFETVSASAVDLEDMAKGIAMLEPISIAFIKFGLMARPDTGYSDIVQRMLYQIDDVAQNNRDLQQMLLQLEDALNDEE
ncbi:MAG: tetratricopeptide repeat protein, partial [Pseudomonadota bacterium]